MSLIQIENEDKQQLSNDFRSALLFTKKLDDIEISEDCEPLENVLDFYGGNQDKMRTVGSQGSGVESNV